MPGVVKVYEKLSPGRKTPDSQSGLSVGASQSAPHSRTVCMSCPDSGYSQRMVSPATTLLGQGMSWNSASQKKMSPTSITQTPPAYVSQLRPASTACAPG